MDNEETGLCEEAPDGRSDVEEGGRFTVLAEEGGRREALEGGRDLLWRELDIVYIVLFAGFMFY